MTNRHYILTLNKNVNPDIGYYDVELIPLSSDANEDFGRYVWYAGPKRWNQQIPDITSPLKLLEQKDYKFDVRSGSKYFYIINNRFRYAVSHLKTSFKQILPIERVVLKNKILENREFYAAIPRKFFESECLLEGNGSLAIKPEFDYDLFDIKDVPIHVATLICSEKCKSVLVDSGISSLNFIPVDEIKYPQSIKSYAFNSSDVCYIPV